MERIVQFAKTSKGDDEMKILTPYKAMRAKCLDYCCDQPKEVELCTCKDNCPLWPYRLGKTPQGERITSISAVMGTAVAWAVFRNGEFVRAVDEKSAGRAIGIVKLIRRNKGLPIDGEWKAEREEK